MKLSTVPSDDKLHVYCIKCRQENTREVTVDGHLAHRCLSCGHTDLRAIIIDPTVEWWIDPSGEYCHQASGIFLSDGKGRFLFYKRAKYPRRLSVSAGHRDKGERPTTTAARELFEETGICLPEGKLTHVVTDDVWGDSCRRGSDMHRWSAYVATMPRGASAKIDASEGSQPVWLTLAEALCHGPTYVMRYMITRHGNAIERAVR